MKHEDLPLKMNVIEDDDHVVITPTGYLNALAGDQIDKICESFIERGTHYFIINFAEIELINTIGISILVGIIEKVLGIRGLVYFTALGGTNREIFEVLNLSTVAMIFPDNAAAQEHLRRDRDTLRRAAMGQ